MAEEPRLIQPVIFFGNRSAQDGFLDFTARAVPADTPVEVTPEPELPKAEDESAPEPADSSTPSDQNDPQQTENPVQETANSESSQEQTGQVPPILIPSMNG
jgi:hypothetical protein